MNVVQTQASIVLLADSHNPTIVTKEWLAQKQVLAEIPVDFTHTPYFSSVETPSFMLYVDPQRLRVDVKSVNQESLSELPRVVEKYVEKLPEVPYSAVGFNSRWQVHDMPSPRMLISVFTGDPKLFTHVFGEQHNVGGIVLWQYDTFQVRMTANPAKANPCIDFNYHLDIKVVDDINKSLSRFDFCMTHANKTANDLLGGDNFGNESASE